MPTTLSTSSPQILRQLLPDLSLSHSLSLSLSLSCSLSHSHSQFPSLGWRIYGIKFWNGRFRKAKRRVLNLRRDAFEKAYAGKNKQWTNETAKAKHDEIVAKKNDYLEELAKEYPEGTSLDEMSIIDQDAGRNIVMDVLGKKLGRPKRRLGFGRVLGSKTSSFSSSASSTRLQQLEDQLVAERTAREAAREANQNYLQKLVQQISSVVPGFVPPQLIL